MTKEHWQVLCGIIITLGTAFSIVLGIIFLVHIGHAVNGSNAPKEPSNYERCISSGGSYSEGEYGSFKCNLP